MEVNPHSQIGYDADIQRRIMGVGKDINSGLFCHEGVHSLSAGDPRLRGNDSSLLWILAKA